MNSPFVWFHNSSEDPDGSVGFYEQLLGWKTAPEAPPGLTMFAGKSGPFAAVAAADAPTGWIPYAQVSNVDSATKQAKDLGAVVVKPKEKGPAGFFSIVKDPGGAVFALWQKA